MQIPIERMVKSRYGDAAKAEFVEVGDLSSWQIEPDRAIADLFSHRGGGQQSREGSPEAVVEQAQHLAIALNRISVEPSDFLPMFFPCSLLPRIR